MDKKSIVISSLVGVILLIIGIFFLIKGCVSKEFTITFNSNGGSVVQEQIVKENHKVKKPANPTKEGYTFMGWYYTDALYDFDTLVKEDMTLEARWEKIGTAKVSGIELNVKELSLGLNETAKLEVTVLPEDAANKKVIWTSSDETVATVDENGLITALKEGKTIITATTEDGSFKATCEVTVTTNVIRVTNVYIMGATEVEVGKTTRLTAVVEPSNASNKGVSWISSDTTIASVDMYGNVFGKRKGTVIITVKTSDGGFMASVRINVQEPSKEEEKTDNPSEQNPEENPTNPSEPTNPDNPKPSEPSGGETDTPTKPSEPSEENPEEPIVSEIKATNVKITSGNLTMKIGEKKTLTATIEPLDTTNKTLTWASSNPAIVKINEKGEIEALSPGNVTITVTTSNGLTSSIEIEVKEKEYVVTLTGLQHQTLPIYQYEITKFTEDEKEIDFQELQFDNGTHIAEPGQTIPEGWIKREAIKNVDIILLDGTKVKATIEYQVRLVD